MPSSLGPISPMTIHDPFEDRLIAEHDLKIDNQFVDLELADDAEESLEYTIPQMLTMLEVLFNKLGTELQDSKKTELKRLKDEVRDYVERSQEQFTYKSYIAGAGCLFSAVLSLGALSQFVRENKEFVGTLSGVFEKLCDIPRNMTDGRLSEYNSMNQVKISELTTAEQSVTQVKEFLNRMREVFGTGWQAYMEASK